MPLPATAPNAECALRGLVSGLGVQSGAMAAADKSLRETAPAKPTALRSTRVLVVDCQASGASPVHADLLALGWAFCGDLGSPTRARSASGGVTSLTALSQLRLSLVITVQSSCSCPRSM